MEKDYFDSKEFEMKDIVLSESEQDYFETYYDSCVIPEIEEMDIDYPTVCTNNNGKFDVVITANKREGENYKLVHTFLKNDREIYIYGTPTKVKG